MTTDPSREEEDVYEGVDSPLAGVLAGGAIVFIGYVVQVSISFFSKAAMARFLGRTGFGSVSIGVTLVTVVSTVTLFGLHTGVGRYLPRFNEATARGRVVLSAFGMALPAALVAGSGLFISAEFLATTLFDDPGLAESLRVFAAAIPASVLMKLTIGGVQGLQNATAKAVIRSLVYPLVLFGGVAFALYYELGATGVAGAYLAAFLLAGAAGCYYLLNGIQSWPSTPSTPIDRELLRFSAPLMIAGLGAIVFSNTDILMLGYFETTSQVGVYAVAFTATGLLLTVLASFRFLYMPSVSELDANEQPDEIRDLYRSVTKWIFFFTFPLFVFMMVFPATVLELAFGAEYISGATVLRVLIAGFFVHAIAGPNGATLSSIGETKIVMLDNTAVALLNVALNATLIPVFSTLGAAVASVMSYVLMNLLFSYHLYVRTRLVPDIKHHGRVAIGTAVPLGLLFLSKLMISDGLLTDVGLMFAFGVVYLLVGTRSVTLQEQEEELVARVRDVIGRKMSLQ